MSAKLNCHVGRVMPLDMENVVTGTLAEWTERMRSIYDFRYIGYCVEKAMSAAVGRSVGSLAAELAVDHPLSDFNVKRSQRRMVSE